MAAVDDVVATADHHHDCGIWFGDACGCRKSKAAAELAALRARIAELEAENAKLRDQISLRRYWWFEYFARHSKP